MRKLSLQMKLAVAFGIPLLILVVLGALTYTSLKKVGELSADVAGNNRSVAVMRNIESRINDQKADVSGFLVDRSRQEKIERYANNNRLLADSFADLTTLVHTEKAKAILAQIPGATKPAASARPGR